MPALRKPPVSFCVFLSDAIEVIDGDWLESSSPASPLMVWARINVATPPLIG